MATSEGKQYWHVSESTLKKRVYKDIKSKPPVSKTVYRVKLAGRMRVFERRYEVSSEAMKKALRAGTAHETADVAEWMWTYRALQKLK